MQGKDVGLLIVQPDLRVSFNFPLTIQRTRLSSVLLDPGAAEASRGPAHCIDTTGDEMAEQRIPIWLSVARFVRAIRLFATSSVGAQARWMFVALVAFLFLSNGLNVVNSYVNRHFMTAITDLDQADFARQAFFYIGVFAASTVVAVLSSFTEQRLDLLWREFVTRRSTERFLDHGTYYRVEMSRLVANPDERITDDVRSFTTTTVSFVLMLLNSSFTIVAFSGVLWSISPRLFLVAVLYAALGSLMSILLGRPLIRLNYDQLDKEANFRSGLIHVRQHAEEIRVSSAETGHCPGDQLPADHRGQP
jgi:putative ATP-binding cassette transporter